MDEIDDEPCSHCGHMWGPHVLIATMFTPEHGGMMFCNQPGCNCQTTWSVEDNLLPWIPDTEEIERLRAIAQDPDFEVADWTLDENPHIH